MVGGGNPAVQDDRIDTSRHMYTSHKDNLLAVARSPPALFSESRQVTARGDQEDHPEA